MQRYELEAMNKEALREHAETMGVTVGPLDTKGTMIDRILGEIKTPPKLEEVKSIQKQPDKKDIPLGALYDLNGQRVNGRKYKLNIFSTESDKSDVDLIVNGHNIRVKRNVDVVVDEAYIGVLKNAVISTVVQDPDTGAKTPQQVQVYPHTATPI